MKRSRPISGAPAVGFNGKTILSRIRKLGPLPLGALAVLMAVLAFCFDIHQWSPQSRVRPKSPEQAVRSASHEAVAPVKAAETAAQP